MKIRWIVLMSSLAMSAVGCNGPSIPVLGIDENGALIEKNIPSGEYSKQLGKVLFSVQDSTLPILEQKNAHFGWQLRTVVVGLGISGEGGIGPIKFGGVSRLKIAFTDSIDPPLP